MNIGEFDGYDQALLHAALEAGLVYARIVGGPEGKWVFAVSKEAPGEGSANPAEDVQVVRLFEIEGLADAV